MNNGKLYFLLLICFAILSCTPPEDTKNKVIIVHARGLTYLDLMNYLKRTKVESFFKDQADKGAIQKLTPITNAVTICNIASFETGTFPSEHGILGHVSGIREGQTIRAVSGFSQRYQVETFWEKADKNGRNVLNIGALALHGKYKEHDNVDCLGQGRPIAAGRFLQLIPKPGQDKDSLILYSDLAGNYKIILQEGSTDTLFVYRHNQTAGEITWIFDRDRNSNNGNIGHVKEGEWLEIEKGKLDGLTEALRIKSLVTYSDTLKLYVRTSFTNRGYPKAFLEQIDANVGPSKGWPNIPLYATGKIEYYTLTDEIDWEVNYIMDVFSYAVKQKEYDLIMIDYPVMDRLGHAFLQLRETSYSVQGNYWSYLHRMDEDFYKIQQYAAENGYHLIIASGHGFAPIHTSININRLLSENGINTDGQNPEWEAVGIPGKVSAHFYVNPQLKANEKDRILKKVEGIFNSLSDPKLRKEVVDKIYAKNELKDIGLNHEHAGDLFILLRPGFVFQNGGNKDASVFGTPLFKGDHGYAPEHESSFGVFISEDSCDHCHTTDIAKRVIRRLGLN